jgi:hypothetical protein
MSNLVTTTPARTTPSAARVAMADEAPSIEELFLFAREAEVRVESLRMDIEEHVVTARGEDTILHEIQLRHPGQARVDNRRNSEPLTTAYDIWLSDGETIQTFEASNKTSTRRRRRSHVAGVDEPSLPLFAQQREPLTPLPGGSLADAFIHPHGLFRNVLVTGPLAIVGTQPVADREAIVVRAEHPRASKVLVDRPDHSIEVGIGRDSGFVLLLTERIGDTVTRHAQVTRLDIDPIISASAFELKLSADTRLLY